MVRCTNDGEGFEGTNEKQKRATIRNVDGLRRPCCRQGLDSQQYMCFIHLCASKYTVTELNLSRCSIKCSLTWFGLFEILIKLSTPLIFLYPRTCRGSSESVTNELDTSGKEGYLPCFKMFFSHICSSLSHEVKQKTLYSQLVFNISALRKIVLSEDTAFKWW